MTNDERFANVLTYIGGRQAQATAAPEPNGDLANVDWSHRIAVAHWQVLAAHAIELRRAEVIDDAAQTAIATALMTAQPRPGAESQGVMRQRVGALEERVEGLVPAAVASVATLGLAREEWLATANRMMWRQLLLETSRGMQSVAHELLRLAEVHAVTIMPAHIGGRAVQPTTLAHYLGGVIAPLQHSQARLVTAWSALNRSPLGSGMLAGDVVAADRGDEAERLGFDGVIPNTFDALGSVEDCVEVLDAIAAGIAPLERFVREIGIWVRTDPTSFVMDEPWLANPEPAHPALQVADRLERLQVALEVVGDHVEGARAALRRISYGPLGVRHDQLGDMVVNLHGHLAPTLAETRAFVAEGLVVNRAYLGNRAGRDYTTASDLAAFLMTEEAIQPEAARRISVLVLSGLKERGLEVSGITPDMIDSAALMTIGREIKVEMETLGRFLAPRRYIERRQVTGSPAPDMTREWLAMERDRFTEHGAWLVAASTQIEHAAAALDQSISEAAADTLEG